MEDKLSMEGGWWGRGWGASGSHLLTCHSPAAGDEGTGWRQKTELRVPDRSLTVYPSLEVGDPCDKEQIKKTLQLTSYLMPKDWMHSP